MMRARLIHVVAGLPKTGLIGSGRSKSGPLPKGGKRMNKIIYIVGLIVIILFVLGFLGLR